jgi:hypothetical protein
MDRQSGGGCELQFLIGEGNTHNDVACGARRFSSGQCGDGCPTVTFWHFDHMYDHDHMYDQGRQRSVGASGCMGGQRGSGLPLPRASTPSQNVCASIATLTAPFLQGIAAIWREKAAERECVCGGVHLGGSVGMPPLPPPYMAQY